jgi:hypothetical protein
MVSSGKVLKTGICRPGFFYGFSFFMAFPGHHFFVPTDSYIPVQNFQNELFLLIATWFQKCLSGNRETVQDFIMRPRGDLLSLGFFMPWFSRPMESPR